MRSFESVCAYLSSVRASYTLHFWTPLPLGFHLIIPLNNDVSCSSVHGSFRMSYAGVGGPLGSSTSGVGASISMPSSSAVGVETSRAPALVFLLGAIFARGFRGSVQCQCCCSIYFGFWSPRKSSSPHWTSGGSIRTITNASNKYQSELRDKRCK
jgi:hypothetical protein